MLTLAEAKAQSGASGDKGTYLNYDDYVNSPRAAGGDVDIDSKGSLQIGVNGRYDIVGALNNKGTITLDSGAVLSIFGNVLNEGIIIVKKGSTINFLGRTWTNTTTAKVTDGAAPNTIPGGELVIDVNRPIVPPSWLTASPYLINYSDENTKQYIDGGNTPMDVVLHLHNQKNIELINTPTKVEGTVHWMTAKSHLIIGNNDFIFTKNANQIGFNENNFIVTNGTGHVVKEDYTGKWIFPVGKDTSDYTPAQIENTTANTMHVLVQDYATSKSEENTATSVIDGIDRTWNIYANIAVGVSSITLQHNTTSNLPAFSEGFNFVTCWSTKTPNLSGDKISTTAWENNNSVASAAGNLSSTGLVAGASMNTRVYKNFATKASDSVAYFTKSSTAFSEAAVQMLSFKADSLECEAKITFKTGRENNISKFQLQHSIDGLTYTTIATFSPKGDNSEYEYFHNTPISGKNYYRIIFIEPSGDYRVSNVVTTTVSCDKEETPIVLYPNPAVDNINFSGLSGQSEIRVINMHGRVMSAITATSNIATLDISGLPAATYIAQIIDAKQKITNIKFVKF